MDEDSPFKEIVDEVFDKLFSIDESVANKIFSDLGIDATIENINIDLEGSEVAIPYVEIYYERDGDKALSTRDKAKIKNAFIEYAIS